jgi:chloride channel 7
MSTDAPLLSDYQEPIDENKIGAHASDAQINVEFDSYAIGHGTSSRDVAVRRRQVSTSVGAFGSDDVSRQWWKEVEDADSGLDETHAHIGHGGGGGGAAHEDSGMHVHSHVHHMTEEEKLLMYSYEGLDYDLPVNTLRRKRQNEDLKGNSTDNILRWLIYAAVGTITGCLAFVLSRMVTILSKWKFDAIRQDIADDKLAGPFFLWMLISGGFVLIATFLVAVVEPVAGGSGIPEIKGYLNGTNYLRFLKIKTLFSKAIGVVFSVSGGLIIGKEGPLVHSGAIIAANISNSTWVNTWSCWTPRIRKWLNHFRNDRDKRDFVAGGAAAGVAAAFGAPVGGILFSLEEASSFWSVKLTWMVFLCAMMGTFFLNVLKIAYKHTSSFSGLISFGPPIVGVPFRIWELPFFILLAVFGGFAGALFNAINERLSRWRRDTIQGRPYHRMAEAVTIGLITAFCAFWAPYLFDHCRTITPADIKLEEEEGESFLFAYRCGENQFNTMASLIFATTESSIRGFFHNDSEYEWGALVFYFVLVFALAVVTYGIAVPSGLFVPCILMGCAFGRLMGEAVRHWFPEHDIIPGTYAIVGATAMLGGVARMTISLTVILVETTQDVEFVMPIMITLMVSKWVGDMFNISLYDLHVELKCMPFVESQPSVNMYHLTAGDVMRKPVQTLPDVTTVGHVLDELGKTHHNGFPLCRTGEDVKQTFCGMIMRNQLHVLLNKGAYGPDTDDALRKVELDDFATSLSSKSVPLFQVSDDVLAERIDLRPFMNPVPISVQPGCPLSRVFTLFRSLGIRHLVVVDAHNMIIGIIGRKEIMSSFDQDLF